MVLCVLPPTFVSFSPAIRISNLSVPHELSDPLSEEQIAWSHTRCVCRTARNRWRGISPLARWTRSCGSGAICHLHCIYEYLEREKFSFSPLFSFFLFLFFCFMISFALFSLSLPALEGDWISFYFLERWEGEETEWEKEARIENWTRKRNGATAVTP